MNSNDFSNISSFTDLPPNNYDCVVKDAIGCVSPILTVVVNPATGLYLLLVCLLGTNITLDITIDKSVQDQQCFGTSTGAIHIIAHGGTGNYFYSVYFCLFTLRL